MEALSVTTVLTSVLLISFIWYIINIWKKQVEIWSFGTGIPGPKPVPLFGSTYLLLGCNLSECFSRVRAIRKQYGKVVQFWFGNHLLITVSEPVCIERTLGNNAYQKRSEVAKIVSKDLFRNGLMLNSGETWRAHRKITMQMFHNTILDMFVENFSRNANIMGDCLKKVADGSGFNSYEYALLCTTDVIYETILGDEINAQLTNHIQIIDNIRGYLHVIGERIRRPWLFIDVIFRMSKLGKDSNELVNFFYDHAKRVLKKSYERRKYNDNKELAKSKRSILDLFVDSGELSESEIMEEVVTMITAGTETTATVFSSALVLLAENQAVQEKVMEEQRLIFGDDMSRPVTSEDLQHMVYLEQVLKEILRLYPPVGFILREVTEDTDLGNGYFAPKGSNITIFTYDTHRDPDYFPEPDKFDPERFSPENSIGRHPYSFIPFGSGRRICIAYKYAMMELKTFMSVILRRYNILSAVDGFAEIEKQMEFGLIIKSSIGYNITIEPR